MTMVFDGRWKYVFAEGFRPMLFDLESDPDELADLGAEPSHQATRDRLERELLKWFRRARSRITLRDEAVTRADDLALAFDPALPAGILIGYWDEAELRREREKLEAALRSKHSAASPEHSRRDETGGNQETGAQLE